MASVLSEFLLFLLFLLDPHTRAELIQDGLEGCRDPKALGMESMTIPDKDIKASSYYDSDTRPEYARIRLDLGGGAWCPMSEVYNDTSEWLQIDLEKVKVITAVETQGRFNGTQMVRWYRLQYLPKVDVQDTWQEYQDSQGKSKIKGNTDPAVAVKQKLDPPITAQRIRIVPQDTKPTYVCMRVELYGCPLQTPTTPPPTEASTGHSTELSTEITSEIPTELSTEITTEPSTDITTSEANPSTDQPPGGRTGFQYFPDLLYMFLAIFVAICLVVAVVVVVRKKRHQRTDMELDSSENAALIT